MRNPFKRKKTKLELEIEALLQHMALEGSGSPKYEQLANELKILCEASSKEPKRYVSPDTWALIGANLAGIALIMAFEAGGHLFRSEAKGFLQKIKI